MRKPWASKKTRCVCECVCVGGVAEGRSKQKESSIKAKDHRLLPLKGRNFSQLIESAGHLK